MASESEFSILVLPTILFLILSLTALLKTTAFRHLLQYLRVSDLCGGWDATPTSSPSTVGNAAGCGRGGWGTL